MIERIRIRNWQQFRDVDLAIHPRLTVVTGANGSGKTTLLRFIARHFGWEFVSLRTPVIDEKRGFKYLIARLFGSPGPQTREGTVIGTISYRGGKESPIRVPNADDQPTYNPSIDQPQKVHGFFIPSHRPDFRYQRVDHLPLRRRSWRQDAFNVVHNAIRSQAQGGSNQGSSYHMKELLIGLAIFGFGNAVVAPDAEARWLYEHFQDVLRKVFPEEFGFTGLAIRDQAEVVFETRSGDFLLDAVSGGIAALMELAWQIFMFQAPQAGPYMVVIDEPENHLHAAMQRTLLPNFADAFPDAQFVVATHSPLIVGSVRESHVYALRFGEDKAVSSEQLDLRDKAGSAEQVLREVLDVGVTIPPWAEAAFETVLRNHMRGELDVSSARRLRQDLLDAGLDRFVPEALERLAQKKGLE